MAKPLLLTAANKHNWITFDAYDTPQWHMSVEWLRHEGFIESGEPVIGFDEGILKSYIKEGAQIAAGFDSWSGNYLLSECEKGDLVILNLAQHISANDCRSAV